MHWYHQHQRSIQLKALIEKGTSLSTGNFLLRTGTSYYDSLTSKANVSSVYSKDEVNTNTVCIAAAIDNKADNSNSYSKTEVDTMVALKANTSGVYSKDEVNNYIIAFTSTLNNKAAKSSSY